MRPALPLLLALALPASAAELTLYPPAVALSGKHARQQLLAVDDGAGRTTADHTTHAVYKVGDPKVAAVSEAGEVTPVGDGETTVTATVGGRIATAKVKVSGFAAHAPRSFRNDVLPLLTRTGCNSGSCHGALAGKGGFKLSLRGYDPDADHFAITRQATARRTDAASPADSLLVKKAVRGLPHGGGKRFDADSEHAAVLLDWIAGGAPGPTDADPSLVRVELFPKPALLKPKDAVRVLAVGHYSDGTTADVTRFARFASSEDLVATVDEDGHVTVTGPGEAAVTVSFGTQVAALPITVPFPAVPPAAFASAKRQTLVDDHVLAKLKLLNVPPSPPCSDTEFVRRVFLDTCGVLPTPAEVSAFLADTAADKRAKLIDKLLTRPEYVDYWAHKWSDLLLVSSRKLPQPAVWAFYRAVRQAVADNRPWDQFARDVLTATGGTHTNGLANYFVLHKDVSQLVETTAVTFLGTSINCARCHNHPLEKWTQDQYWATANLFARVGLKDGDRGEVTVRTLPDGDARHLRRGVPMTPAPLDGPPLPEGTDRRAHFADWLTKPDNPFFARAIVNRVWRNYMGRGLVEPEDDIRDTNPSSNRELFDALTAELVANKYDLKHLTRVVLNSAAYQRSSAKLPANAADDRFYSRYLVRRLSAEVLLDAYADVTGVPSDFTQLQIGVSGGMVNTTSFPRGTRAMQLPDALLVSRFLDAFGRAERVQTCSCETTTDSSVAQALHLNNGKSLNDKLRGDGRIGKWVAAGRTDEQVIGDLFALALCRPPTAAETAKLLPVLKGGDRRAAVEDLAWAVLTSQEFVFNR